MREIIYDHYFWQNTLVRLRALEEDDWEIIITTFGGSDSH